MILASKYCNFSDVYNFVC